MERIDDTPVHKAVREGLTNMIIHADLLITGVLKVVKRDNGILFSNPGSLKIPFEDIKRGGNSKARNPRIQNMLRMVGFGDNIGSGYPTILKAWKDQNWRCPTLLDRPELRQVDLTLPMISLLPEQTLHEMQHTLGEQEYARLSANEQTALAYVWNGEDVSNAVLQQLLSLNSIEAGRLLHNMVDKGLLNQDSKGRWTTYALQKTLFERLETDVKEKSEGKEKKMKEKSEGKGKRVKEKGEGKEFSLQEKAVARYLKERNEATYKELAEAMKISEATIYRIIKKMRGKGILQRQAGRKNGKWAVWWDEENQ
jgi:ATP-dependent DNA helicase RecG